MSADNWAVCPRCFDKMKLDAAKKAQEAKDEYGEEWLKFHSLVWEPEPEPEPDLREDYEIYFGDDGEFVVSYHCKCAKCGFEFSYGHREVVYVSVA